MEAEILWVKELNEAKFFVFLMSTLTPNKEQDGLGHVVGVFSRRLYTERWPR